VPGPESRTLFSPPPPAAELSHSERLASLAAEQGREVFAVPGHPLDPRAEGTNKLLKSGATLVTEASDLLSALTPLTSRPAMQLRDEGPAPLSQGLATRTRRTSRTATAAASWGPLGPAPVDVDAVVRGTGRAVQIALIELALAGRIERHGNGLVSLARAPDQPSE